MDLILGAALVVAAWMRGWKALSLIPFAVYLCVCFFSGIILGRTGIGLDRIYETSNIIATVFFVITIIVLVVMVIVKREQPTSRIIKTDYIHQIVCPGCSAPVAQDSKFCTSCGSVLNHINTSRHQ